MIEEEDNMTETRIETINRILDDQSLSMSCKSLLCGIWRFADKSGHAFPSVELLMKTSSVGSRTTFYKCRDELVRLGWIEISNNNKGTQYKIRLSENGQRQSSFEVCESTSGTQNRTITENEQKYIINNEPCVQNWTSKEKFYADYKKSKVITTGYYNWMEELSSEFIC